MDPLIFSEEIEIIESCFPRYKVWNDEDSRKHAAFRRAFWEAVKELSDDTIREARRCVSDGYFGDDMPTVPKLVSFCKDQERQKQLTHPNPQAIFKPASHQCCVSRSEERRVGK